MNIRLLKPSEIDVRVATIKETGCSLLLYKDARVDMKILDETFGPLNWQRTHEVINGNLFCNIEIWDDEKKTWVKKQDVGVESYTEKQKGEASDSFKRAGFNIGIGRELYTAPFIWVRLEKSEIYDKGGKTYLKSNVKFTVKEIEYNDEREIETLVIVDSMNKVRFEKGVKCTEEQMTEYTNLLNLLTEKNVLDYHKFNGYLESNYNVHTAASLTKRQMEEVLEVMRIKKTKLGEAK